MRRLRRTEAAPDGWVLELVRVPAGADVDLDLRLESVMDGVLVTGTVTAPVVAECGRCLEPVEDSITVDVQELFAYDEAADGEDELPTLVGDFIDFEPIARDAVVLGLPLNPVCRDDCAGLCTGCGAPMRDLTPEHAHDEIDPRWAALTAVRTDADTATSTSDVNTESGS
jgi:uncharacterized protein